MCSSLGPFTFSSLSLSLPIITTLTPSLSFPHSFTLHPLTHSLSLTLSLSTSLPLALSLSPSLPFLMHVRLYHIPFLPYTHTLSHTHRQRLQLTDSQAFYILINGRTMAGASMMLRDVYSSDKDEDGFLYCTYTSQEAFG